MKDYGCDPLGGGKFKLIPSGRIVDEKEKNKLFPPKTGKGADCVGLTWEQIEQKQGGKLTRDV